MLFRETLLNRAMSTSSSHHHSLCSMLSSTTWAFSRTLTGTPINGSVCGTVTFNPTTTATPSNTTTGNGTTTSSDSTIRQEQLRYVEDGTLTLGSPSSSSSASLVHLPVKQEYLYVDNVFDHSHCPTVTTTTCAEGTACGGTTSNQQQQQRNDGCPLGVLFPDGRPFLQFHFPHLHGDISGGGIHSKSPSWLAEVSSLSPETHLNGGSSGINVWHHDVDSHLCGQDLYNSKFYLGYLPSSTSSSSSSSTTTTSITMPYVLCMEYVVKGPKKDYTARSVLVRKHSSKVIA